MTMKLAQSPISLPFHAVLIIEIEESLALC